MTAELRPTCPITSSQVQFDSKSILGLRFRGAQDDCYTACESANYGSWACENENENENGKERSWPRLSKCLLVYTHVPVSIYCLL
jgi:hypothetical protein